MSDLSDAACAREAREERTRRWLAWWLLAVVAILSAAAVFSPRAEKVPAARRFETLEMVRPCR